MEIFNSIVSGSLHKRNSYQNKFLLIFHSSCIRYLNSSHRSVSVIISVQKEAWKLQLLLSETWDKTFLTYVSLFQVTLVFPNNDPAAFMVAFYGCLLAEVVPVPIEVPLTRKVGN